MYGGATSVFSIMKHNGTSETGLVSLMVLKGKFTSTLFSTVYVNI